MNLRLLTLGMTLALAWLPAHAPAGETVFDVDHIFAPADVDTLPEILKTIQPAYPDSLKGTGKTGLAAVAVVIDQMGDIEDIQVIKASSPEFARPAEDCVRYWRFLAANRGGRSVKVRLVIPLRFAEAAAHPAK